MIIIVIPMFVINHLHVEKCGKGSKYASIHFPSDVELVIKELLRGTPKGPHLEILLALQGMYESVQRRARAYKLPGSRNLSVHPITFSIPEQHLVHTVPGKVKPLASVIPGDKSTYKFLGNGSYQGDRYLERDFYEDVSSSYFAFTFKKAGWDCMRHLEILARGSLPVFTDINDAPEGTCAFYPKEVLSALLKFPGIRHSGRRNGDQFTFAMNFTEFDPLLYAVSVNALLEFTRKKLTTKAMAQYVLDVVKQKPKRLLFLAPKEPVTGDYLADTLLHGFKQILGQHNVVDVAPREVIVKGTKDLDDKEFISSKTKMYGKGFTFSKVLFEYPNLVDRSNITEKLKHRFFDMVVFGMGHRNPGPSTPHFQDVCRYYPPEKVVLIFGDDFPVQESSLLPWVDCAQFLFSREIGIS